MGLLEYQAMPSLRDVAHDGGLCTFSKKPEQVVWSIRAGGQGPSITYKITPCSSPANQAGRRVGPALYSSVLLVVTELGGGGGGICQLGYRMKER
jgi:hypothetical protein